MGTIREGIRHGDEGQADAGEEDPRTLVETPRKAEAQRTLIRRAQQQPDIDHGRADQSAQYRLDVESGCTTHQKSKDIKVTGEGRVKNRAVSYLVPREPSANQDADTNREDERNLVISAPVKRVHFFDIFASARRKARHDKTGLDVRPLTSPPIGQALAIDAGSGDFDALHVGVAESNAMVVAGNRIPPCIGADALRNMVVDTDDPAFQDRKVIFDRVGMPEVGSDIFLGAVVHGAVACELFADLWID
jgi:hypothetical protein